MEELWTGEKELFLHSTTDKIQESLEELNVMTKTIALQCMEDLDQNI